MSSFENLNELNRAQHKEFFHIIRVKPVTLVDLCHIIQVTANKSIESLKHQLDPTATK